MKILFSSQIFQDQKFGGISRYYSEIYKGILKNELIQIQLPLLYSENLYIKDVISNDLSFYKILIALNLFKKSIIRKIHRYDVKSLKVLLKKQQYDLFIPTYYDTDFIDYIGNKPFVLSVYDMIHEKFPHLFLNDLTTVRNKKLLIGSATKIIAVSHNTKKDIIEIYPEIDASKIIVVYHGSSLVVDQKYHSLPSNYILYVGSRFGYKNFGLLLKGCEKILKSEQDLFLVCAGGGSFSTIENNLIEDLKITAKVKQINFDENQLGFIYNNAKIFIFPSEYEGFGIPVLESMSCGCPVILSNSSSFPEVAENAGLFFEYNNEKDLEDKILLLLKNETYRKEIIDLGYAQANKFSWETAVNQCIDVYKLAIESSE